MMAAKGMAPLPPREMVITLCGLTYDAEERLNVAAGESLKSLPEKILGPALDSELPPAALFALIPNLEGKDDLLSKIVTQRNTPDDVIAAIAPTASEQVAEIISNDQERCMRSEKIVDAIRKNSNVLKSSLDRLFDFLTRSGVIYR